MNRKDNRAAAEAWLETLRPDIEKLCRDVDNQGNAIITGFIFCQNPPCIAHLTTATEQGDKLIRLHLVLSSLVAEQSEHSLTRYPNVTFKEFGPGATQVGRAPEEIADELAQLLLVTGADQAYLNQIYELAQSYLLSRRKTSEETPEESK